MNPDLASPDPQTDPVGRNRVTLAFLLGWAVSETLGHLRKGVRPSPASSAYPADYAPRLTASQGEVQSAPDAFLFSAERIVDFYRELGFESGGDVSPLTREVNELPGRIRAWLENRDQSFYSAHDLRQLLEAWTLHVWALLNGASVDSARAMTAGMSLADTYWYMRLPSRRRNLKATQTSEEDWRRLLSKYRLDVARSRLRTLESNFTPFVIPVVRNHLRRWSIGTELCYQEGKLARRKGCKEDQPLQPADEARLQRALGRQIQNWEAMLFGLREPQTYLLTNDRRLITIGRWIGLFVADLLTALFLLVAAAVVAYFLAITLLPSLFNFLNNKQAGVSDWLAIISLLWTILIAVPAPLILRAAYQFTRGAQRWFDTWLTVYFITRRTYIPWDQYMK